jgi:hypothetical protein
VANGEDPVLRAAFDDVIADRRYGDRTLSRIDALLDAYDHVGVTEPHGVGRLAVAYRTTLVRLQRAPTRDELGELIRRLTNEDVSTLSTLQEFWVARIRRGDPI